MKNKTYPCWSWLPIPLVPTIKTFTALLKPSMTQSVHPSIHPSMISHFLDKEDVSHNNIYIGIPPYNFQVHLVLSDQRRWWRTKW